jgi:diguanylate cyclase (GGDEF)-like protein
MKLLIIIFLFISSLLANEKVTLQLKWLHQFQFAGYYAAKEKGFYSQEGLDVEIKERDRSKNNIEQVISGEAEYGVADSILLLYRSRKEPLVIIAPIFQHSPNVLFTLKSSGLDSPYKLNNKNIMFYNKDADGFGILAMFKHLEIEPFLDRTKDKKHYSALIERKIDAYAGYLSNEAYYFKKEGVDVNIINPANYGFDLYGDMLFTNAQEAQNHPQRVEKFKRSTIKGWEYALEHKEEIIQLIKKKYAKNKSVEHLRYEADALEEIIQRKSIPIGTLDKGRIKYTLKVYEDHGLIKNNIDVEDYIFDSFKPYDNTHNNIFNAKEKEYLAGKKSIKMCIDPDWMPFEKNDNGKHIGMTADYKELLQKEIGIPIETVLTKTWIESLDIGQNRGCDIFSLVMPTKERLKYLDFTKPYLKIPLVIVTNLDELFINDISSITDKKIGIVKGYAYGEILKEKYPQMNLIEVENLNDGLNKVRNGTLFGFIGTLATTGYKIQKEYIGELKIAGKFDEKWELGIGTRNDEPILKDIFDKALKQLPVKKHQEILNKWISVNYDNGVDYKQLLQWIFGISLVFIAALSVVLRINRRLNQEINSRKQTEKRLQELSVTDELTGLYNRRFFNTKFTKTINSAKREGKNVCFVLMDIDHFKLYNDTYGHLNGDKALQKLSKSMLESLSRADDYCFRLGGEEFGMLFKGLTKAQATKLTQKIRKNIEALKIEHKNNSASEYLTGSFGLVVKSAQNINSENELYREADELLYKAKKEGRNRVCVND